MPLPPKIPPGAMLDSPASTAMLPTGAEQLLLQLSERVGRVTDRVGQVEGAVATVGKELDNLEQHHVVLRRTVSKLVSVVQKAKA